MNEKQRLAALALREMRAGRRPSRVLSAAVMNSGAEEFNSGSNGGGAVSREPFGELSSFRKILPERLQGKFDEYFRGRNQLQSNSQGKRSGFKEAYYDPFLKPYAIIVGIVYVLGLPAVLAALTGYGLFSLMGKVTAIVEGQQTTITEAEAQRAMSAVNLTPVDLGVRE